MTEPAKPQDEPEPLNSVHGGIRAGMASKTDRVMSLRAVRQLRRIRAFYTAGVLLWTASTAWSGWQSPGSRQMWVSALLLAVFTYQLLYWGWVKLENDEIKDERTG